MRRVSKLFRGRRCLLTVAVTAVFVLAAEVATAQVVALVNGEPITALDIAQRTRLIQISTHKNAPRQEVLEELIDEKLKLSIAKRYKLDIRDSEVEGTFAGMAKRSGLTPDQFTKALASSGIQATAIKEKIKVDIGWSQIIRGKFHSNLQVGERDVLEALQAKQKDVKETTASFEYTLRPILLIVPRGSPEGAFAARQREAEGLRGRFQDCTSGLATARTLRDVAIRAPVTRTSADLSPQLRQILDSMQIGRLTAPEVTAQGVEVFALCGRKESGEDSPAKRQMRDTIVAERYQAESKRYLQELRRGALIEYR